MRASTCSQTGMFGLRNHAPVGANASRQQRPRAKWLGTRMRWPAGGAMWVSILLGLARLRWDKRGHLLARKPACSVKKLIVGPWVGMTGPPHGVHRSSRPFCRRFAPGLNWPGRASGAVTLKKLECSKQAYALDTLAWDNIIGFRSYSIGL
ncbi:hypothetical protein L1049_027455 [Liquidambar formosana]|uniref:Uncharacterized protein n=1 Tax=Liquidambar formosana TaxID=63359 RepID=A0AAP0WVF7_LIQFO